MKIRTFGLASIAIAIAGLIVLWFFATRAPIAHVTIEQIQSTANYAYVQLDGVVSRGPNYNAGAQALTFWVRDDTGEMMVSAFRAQVDDLSKADKIPAPGDTVSIQGTVRVRETVPALTIDSAEAVTLSRATANAPARDIGSITPDDALHGVTVQGVVRAIKEPYAGLRLITLRDQTGAIDVAVPTELEPLLGAAAPITIDQSARVVGAVTLFETTPQITLHHGGDLTVLNEGIEIARPVSIGSLSDANVGHWVWIRGTLETIDPFSAGVKLTLSDSRSRATVLVWQDLWDALTVQYPQLQLAAQLSITGEVSSFQGQLEIAPGIIQDVQLLGPPPKVEAVQLPIGAIDDGRVGSIVMTTGTIETVIAFQQGVRYALADQGHSITLLIWNDVIEQAKQRESLKAGSSVSVTGKIDLFNNQLEIVPQAADQITAVPATPIAAVTSTPTSTPTIAATEPATPTPEAARSPTPGATKEPAPTSTPAAPAANAVTIKSLTRDSVGQTVAIHGKVVETASFSAGFKFLIDDGTGRINLTLFGDVYQHVPNRVGLNLGADVTIVGNVAEFQGVLELQPKSGRDVTINSPGSSASVPVVPINSLKKAGLLVAIEGTITDVTGFSAGRNVFVDDGTGNVRVTLFNNVLAYVPNATGLVKGAKVRVVGKTEFFGGIQVAPALGYDVTIQ
jgi:DNA/RNA endonuclease YhcR with UshA esterase domain